MSKQKIFLNDEQLDEFEQLPEQLYERFEQISKFEHKNSVTLQQLKNYIKYCIRSC